MTFLLLLTAILSLLTLGAHFFRAGNWVGVVAAVALLALLAVRKAWVARVVPAALVLGALEWIRTAVRIGSWRMQQGHPWVRMAVILGVVALITGLSALPFLSKRLKAWYRVDTA